MIFADETDYVSSIAEYAENKGLLVSYALMSSEELPVLAKIIIAIGAALIVILVVMSIVIINATIVIPFCPLIYSLSSSYVYIFLYFYFYSS